MANSPPSDASPAAAKVDVIIAAWRCGDTIGAAVRSALDQGVPTRVIVIDDASGDDTADRAAAASDSAALEVIRCATNGGPSVARNAGLAAGSAEWVAILDSDDRFEPQRLARLLALADDADVVADDLLVVEEDDPTAPPTRLLGDRYDDAGPIDLATFVAGNIPDASAHRSELGFIKPIIRRSFLDRHGLRYDPTLWLGEDYDLYARCLAHGAKLRLVPPQGYIYMKRAGSISGTHATDDLLRLREVDTRLLAMPGLDPRTRRIIARHRESTDARLQWRRVIDAVKARQPGVVLSAFLRSPRVSAYVAAQLWEQLILRSRQRLGG